MLLTVFLKTKKVTYINDYFYDYYANPTGETLNINEKILGEEHPLTAVSYNNIGLVYYNLGEYSKALEQVNNNIGESVLSLYDSGKLSGLTEVLFIERCLRLLKPGGRLGIVLPEGVLNNRRGSQRITRITRITNAQSPPIKQEAPYLRLIPRNISKLIPGMGRERTERYSSLKRLFTHPFTFMSAHLNANCFSTVRLLI